MALIALLAATMVAPNLPVEAKNLKGSLKADRIVGTKKADTLRGYRGNDRLLGRGGNDRIYAGHGRDWLVGGRGNDFLHGGRGYDQAFFRGKFKNYKIIGNQHKATVRGPDGKDTLRTVERLVFGDGTKVNMVNRNTPPQAKNDRKTGTVNQELVIPVADLLKNDWDYDGDRLEITAVGKARNGSVVLAGNEVVFTPDVGFQGNARFQYTLSDGKGNKDKGFCIITLEPAEDDQNLIYLAADFDDNSDDGFSYQDDPFRGTSQPGYASGQRIASGGFGNSGALRIELGGQDNLDITNMSGSWDFFFEPEEDGPSWLSFRYKMTLSGFQDTARYVDLLVGKNQALQGSGDNGEVVRLQASDDPDEKEVATGWRTATVDLGDLSKYGQWLRLGGFLNGKKASDQTAEILIDQVRLLVPNSAPIGPVVDSHDDPNEIDEDAGVYQDTYYTGLVARAVDPDPNSGVSYTFLNGAQTDANNQFQIDAVSGEVTVVPGAKFDNIKNPSHDVTVIASSRDGSQSQGTFEIKVNNVPFTLRKEDMNGKNGVAIKGLIPGDQIGTTVSGIGDINGDGFDDIAFAPNVYSLHKYLYVLLGSKDGINPDTKLDDLGHPDGFRIGEMGTGGFFENAYLGGGSDLNGDGFEDFIFSENPYGYKGPNHVIFGSDKPFPNEFDLTTIDGENGFHFGNYPDPEFVSDIGNGIDVTMGGDINGDGRGDTLFAVDDVYLIHGQDGNFASVFDQASINGSNGSRLTFPQSGMSVEIVRDLNGDKRDDLIFAKRSISASLGIIFGQPGGFGPSLDTTELGMDQRVEYDVTEDGILTVGSAQAAGDINGDGINDMVATPNYVFFGRADGFGDGLTKDDLDGKKGFRFSPDAFEVSGAGDLNGDGYDDLILADPRFSIPDLRRNRDISQAGQVFVLYGKNRGFGATVDLNQIEPGDGFRVVGDDTLDGAGQSVSSAGDINGDGYDDLLVGVAEGDADSYLGYGHVMIIYGKDTGAVTHQGTDGDDKLVGNSKANILVGGQGNDAIEGRRGADVYKGGAGDDLLRIWDLKFRRLEGDRGEDFVTFTQKDMHLDLRKLGSQVITGIEGFKLTGKGDNSLTLGINDLLQLSDHSNRLRVHGNRGDVVNLIGDWRADGTTYIAPLTYYRYVVDGVAAEVLVEDDNLTVNIDPLEEFVGNP